MASPTNPHQMSRSIGRQIYLKKGVPEDDLLLALGEALKNNGRPQDQYRRMLLEGFFWLAANGEMPKKVMDDRALQEALEAVGGIPDKFLPRPAAPQYVLMPSDMRAAPGHFPSRGSAGAPGDPSPLAPPQSGPSSGLKDSKDSVKPKKALDANLM